MRKIFWGILFSFPSISFPQASFNTVHVPSSDQLPIKSARTISFTTDEGSNMSVDISPDGKTIVFSLLGELFTLPAFGGQAKQLTRGLAVNSHPVWSPDGKSIAYISDGSGDYHLHLINLTGDRSQVFGKEDRPVNFTVAPVWSPDCSFLIADPFIYTLSGGKLDLPKGINNVKGISANGQYLYYQQYNGATLTKFDIRNGQKTVLFENVNNVKFSKDGRWMVYMTGNWAKTVDRLIIYDLNKKESRLLVKLNIQYPGPILSQHYSFSPDSRFLYIGYGGKIHRIDINTGTNEIIPFSATVNIEMGPFNYNEFKVSHKPLEAKYIRSAQTSPDGKHLVFAALGKIYLMDLPNGTPRVLTEQETFQFQPDYSPDGKFIIYTTWKISEGGAVWKVSSSGGNPEKITNDAALYHWPSWSPNGASITVLRISAKDDKRQIQVISLLDKTIKVIADTVAIPNQPIFSVDGESIIYRRSATEDNNQFIQLVSRKIGTKNDYIIASKKNVQGEDIGSPVFFRQMSISPDARFVAFSQNGELYLMPVINVGAPIQICDPSQRLPLIRFARAGYDLNWEKNGKILSWTFANKHFRIDPDKIIAVAENKFLNGADAYSKESACMDVNVTPDEIVDIKVTVPRNYGKGTIALTGVRVITMKSDSVIENATILINDGRFAEIGANEKIIIPNGAKIYDLKGKTIMPGLIDMHYHDDRSIVDVLSNASWMPQINLAYGVTTQRDPSSKFESIGWNELIEIGKIIGPRLYTACQAIRPNYSVANLKDARALVEYRSKLGGMLIKQYQQPSRLERQLLLMASCEFKLNMTNEGSSSMFEDIGMLKDGSTGIEHNPMWGEVYKDVYLLFAKSGVFFTPTLQVSYSMNNLKDFSRVYFRNKYLNDPVKKLDHFSPPGTREAALQEKPGDSLLFVREAKVDATIRKYGGKVTMGSHGEDQGIGAHFEMWAMQMGGLTNMQTLQAATILGAEGLGMQKDLGSIEVGKIADLIILDKNPLDDIHNTTSIKYVMKDGVLYDGNTMDQLWPVYKKCPEWKMKEELIKK